MALDHSDKIDWEDLDADDAVDAALLVKRDEHERYESDEATVDVVDSKDGSARCYILADYDAESPQSGTTRATWFAGIATITLGISTSSTIPKTSRRLLRTGKGMTG